MFYQYGSACYVALDDRKVHFIEERSKGGSHANNETELTNLLHVALWWKCFVWQPGFHMACTQTKLTFCTAFDSFISYIKREADTSHSYRVYSMKLMQLVGDQWHSMIISEEDCNKVIINKYR
jgi:hypothetical protein